MPSGLCQDSQVAVHRYGVSGVPGQREAGEALRNAHASFSLVRVRKPSASTPMAHEVVGRRSVGLPAMMTCCAPASRERGRRSLTPLGVGRVGAGEADDRLAVVRRDECLDTGGRPGDLDGDATGGEQVGGESRARGVLGDGAHRGKEDRRCVGFVAERLEGRAVATYLLLAVERVARSGRSSARLGNSLTTGDRPLARGDLGLALRDRRLDRAASMSPPPSTSIRPNSSQAATARSSVSFSTAYAPPAGSATSATCDSSIRRCETLRAIRRPKASGWPSGLSNGSTVTASAPPTPAANAATVVRSMFT